MKKSLISFVAILAVCLVFTDRSQAALVDGLENYWNYDNNLLDQAHGLIGSASTVADNGSFAGTNGTGGIGFGVGLFGGAITQDGASGAAQNNGHVNVGRSADTLHGGENLAISTWVRTDGFDTGWQAVVAHGEGNQYRIARRGGGSEAAYAGGSGEGPAGGQDLTDGAWHHIVAMSELGVSTRLYVDGVLQSTGGAPNINDAQGGGTLDLLIGANPNTGAQNREWLGEIDDTAIWNRVLSEDEITQIFAAGQAGNSLGILLIPEPTTGLLALMGMTAGAFVRRRRNA